MRTYHNGFKTIFIALFILCVVPLHSFAAGKANSMYTVQIATHHDVEAAQQHFNTIAITLDKKNLEYLRIEKIGKFYSLRLGKFDNNNDAKQFMNGIKPQIPSGIVMKAYLKEDRIIRMYEPQSTAEEETIQPADVSESVTKTETGKTGPPANDNIHPDYKTMDNAPLEEKIASVASLVNNKDYDSALVIMKKEIAEYPQHPELNAWYGTVLVKTNKPEEALKYLEKAVALSPSVPDYYNSLGYCLFYLNETEKSVDAFNNALALEPGHVDALSGIGIIYAKWGDKEKTLEVYNKLKNLDEVSANKLLKLVEGAGF